MRKLIVPLFAASMFCSMPMLVGCDREVAKESTTTTHSNGETTHSDTTVKQTPSGDLVKEKSTETHSNP